MRRLGQPKQMELVAVALEPGDEASQLLLRTTSDGATAAGIDDCTAEGSGPALRPLLRSSRSSVATVRPVGYLAEAGDGAMFWLIWKRLFGSYLSLSATSRVYFSGL
jgi:hypothetical protein